MELGSDVLRRLNSAPSRTFLPVHPQAAAIPKIIHQTFYTRAFPPLIEENLARIRRLNPEWSYRFYGDDDVVKFIRSKCDPGILSRFQRISPRYGAARADLFRYLVMYEVGGGVYLDIKAAATRPLDDVLHPTDRYLLCQWAARNGEPWRAWGIHPELARVPGGEYQRWQIVCAPGHPFLKAVIENVLRNIRVYHPDLHGVGRMAVLRVTGPIAYTLAIVPIVNAHPHRFADSERELGFQYSVFGASDVHAHRKIFKSHDTQLKEPVVLPSQTDLLVSPGIGLLRWIRNAIRSLR